MSDPLAVALARLAPTVDLAASRDLLDRSLDGAAGAVPPPSNRRRLLAAACVILILAGALGVWAVSGRDEADAPAAPTTVSAGRGDGTEFRVIAVEPVGDFEARSIRTAGTDDELVSIVSRFGPDFAPFAPDVDLTREVALVIERPDNSCPSEIDRFEPIDDAWEVVWRKPGGDCVDVGIGWVYLVAIDRSALAGIAEFVLPAEQHGSFAWEELRVAKPADPAIGPTFTSSSDGGVDGTFPAHDIAAITEQAEWDAYVASDMPLVEASAVDLADFVVVVIRRPDAEGCPGSFDGFDVAGDVWIPRFAAVDAEGCSDTPMTTRYDVAVRRAALPDEVTFHLPADAVFDLPAVEVTLRVREQSIVPTAPPTTPVFGGAEQAALDAATTLVLEAQSSAEPGTAAGAATALQYEAIWSRFLGAPEAPTIDLATDVAIVFMMLDDGCVAEFRGLTVSRTDSRSTRLVPRFQEPGASECNDVGFPRLFVLSVDRDVLPDTFEFLVPRAYAPSTENGVVTTIDLSAPATSSNTLGLDPALVVPPMSFARSEATLDALESRLGLVGMFSQVDLGKFAVIAFAVGPGECASTFDRFDIGADGVWTPLFRESGPCDDALPRLVAVSVDREALVGGITFRYRDAVLTVDPDYAIVDAAWDCGPEDSRQFTITLDLPPNGDVAIDVVADDVVGGSARVQVGSDGLVSSTAFGVTGVEPSEADAVVSDVSTGREVARTSLAHLPIPTCG
jgi:hypothetical protein